MYQYLATSWDAAPIVTGFFPFYIYGGGLLQSLGGYIILVGGLLGFLGGAMGPYESRYEK